MAELKGQSLIWVAGDSLDANDAIQAWAEENSIDPNREGMFEMSVDEFTSIADEGNIPYRDFALLSKDGQLLDADDIEDAYYFDPEDPYEEEDPFIWEEERF